MGLSNEVKVTGGAQIGSFRATWPFITLIVNKERLELKASIGGNYVFMPSDVISIDEVSGFSSFGGSIRIRHRVETYSPDIEFQYSGSSAELIRKIHQTGFLSNTDPVPADIENEIIQSRSGGNFPIKTSAAIVIVVIWNLLICIDIREIFRGHSPTFSIGQGIGSALGFMIVTCVLLLTVGPFRNIVLKKGKKLSDIRGFLFFILVICAFMLLITSLIVITPLRKS